MPHAGSYETHADETKDSFAPKSINIIGCYLIELCIENEFCIALLYQCKIDYLGD